MKICVSDSAVLQKQMDRYDTLKKQFHHVEAVYLLGFLKKENVKPTFLDSVNFSVSLGAGLQA